MKIKSIKVENSPILGDQYFDFCDKKGIPYDTIILAGENGCGKSTVLNMIYEFSNFLLYNNISRDEKRIFIISINEAEKDILRKNELLKSYLTSDSVIKDMVLTFDFSIVNDWQYIGVDLEINDNLVVIPSHLINNDAKLIFRTLFSDVEINYSPSAINGVTSKNIDEEVVTSVKSSGNLANEITQLLIDVQALDDADLGNWVKENQGKTITVEKQLLRMDRFEEAFHSMFMNKRYKCIRNVNGAKQILFEEHGKEIEINNLSSGEKQIVFRGGFLLKDKKSIDGSLILLDEPEISLHPKWQMKILEYYKKLFTNENGEQTSQLIISTHSPFVIHNKNRDNDKVIVMQKQDNGLLTLPEDPKFYGWTSEQEIKHAFNLNLDFKADKALVITEGKTDWKHLKKAFTKLISNNLLDATKIQFDFLEYDEDIKMGSDELKKMCVQFSKKPQKNKIIFVFDRDEEQILREVTVLGQEFKSWGNNVYSLAIPVPEHRVETPQVCIEFYYENKDLFKVDINDRRLFFSNEFNPISTRHRDSDLVCSDSKIRGTKISIIDCNVFDAEDKNVALSKNDFANCIVNEQFTDVVFSHFLRIGQIIQSILEE